jgi:hypothetical protein
MLIRTLIRLAYPQIAQPKNWALLGQFRSCLGGYQPGIRQRKIGLVTNDYVIEQPDAEDLAGVKKPIGAIPVSTKDLISF